MLDGFADAGGFGELAVELDGGIEDAPGQLRFFADDNLVAYELPQAVAADGHGGFVLTLPLSPDGPADAKGLHGVLTSSTGWLADGSLPGLRVDAPFTATSATIASTQSKAATPGSGPAASVNLLGTLVLAFIGGAILNLMPCVFPVLGIKIPHVTIPVRKGRDLGRLVEVAALDQKLKSMGQNSALEFNQRLLNLMQKKT